MSWTVDLTFLTADNGYITADGGSTAHGMNIVSRLVQSRISIRFLGSRQ